MKMEDIRVFIVCFNAKVLESESILTLIHSLSCTLCPRVAAQR